MGYFKAGFDVTGVDHEPQPRYPFKFICADALEYLAEFGHCYDVIAGSPPCQDASIMRRGRWKDREHPQLIPATRAGMIATGKPYVIENVVGADLINPVLLCGSMFELQVGNGTLFPSEWGEQSQLRRHRLFEMPWYTGGRMKCSHARGSVIGVYGGGQHPRRRVPATIGDMTCFTVDARAQAMNIDWMTGDELSQAIPPPYTEWVGRRLIVHLKWVSP